MRCAPRTGIGAWLCLIVLSGSLQSFAAAESTTVESAVISIVENWNQIKTWTGTAIVEDQTITDGRQEVCERSRVDFAFDRRSRRYRWSSKAELFSPRDRATATAGNRRVDGLVKYGALYQFADQLSLTTQGSQSGRRTLSITDWSDRRDPFATGEFDALYYMTAGCDPLDHVLRRLGGASALPADWSVKTAPTGKPDGFVAQAEGFHIEATVDQKSGKTLGIVLRMAGDRRQTWTFHHRVDGNDWLPSEIIIDFDHSAGGALRRNIQFVKSRVNQELLPDEWSLSRIGISPGDLVRDERTQVQYVHNNDRSDSAPMTPRGNTPDSTMFVLTINIGAWLVVLAGSAVVSRWRRPRMAAAPVTAAVDDL